MMKGVPFAELEARLCSLPPRAELVARMAIRLHYHDACDKKNYFARIAALIKQLDLTAEALSVARADAQKVAASLNGAMLSSDELARALDP